LITLILGFLALTLLAAPPSPDEVVERFVAAFNRHDVSALVDLAHPQIEWLSVSGAQVTTEGQGREAIASSLSSYFESCPTCRAVVEVSSVNGPYVAAIETASWEADGTTRSQKSTSVYEIIDGQVRRVWYFPSVRPR
jgi:hypothetical protein